MTQRDDSVAGEQSPSAAVLSDRAAAFALSGDLARATALYRELVAAHPDHPGTQRKLAFLLQSGGAPEEASACYRRAIALDPADARAHDELGRLIGLRGDMAAATPHLRAAIPGSLRGAEITARFQRRLGRAFAAAGLDAARHVVLLPPMSTADFLGVAQLCDVFLDSLGWSGYNSALECLACALPIVTWPGPLMRGRHAGAILQMLGITETIAASPADYMDIAVRLANDPAWRAALRARIAASRSSILADPTPVRALEDWLDARVRPASPHLR